MTNNSVADLVAVSECIEMVDELYDSVLARKARQELAALTPASAEPVAVAWRYRYADGGAWSKPEYNRRTAYGRTGYEEQPLYAHPAPVTVEAAEDIWKLANIGDPDDPKFIDARPPRPIRGEVVMSEVDISRERIERLKAMGCADYIHIALLDKIDDLAKERDELRAALDHMTAIKDIDQTKRYENWERAEKAEAEVERLRRVLRGYKEDLCEGYCNEDEWADAGHCHPDFQRDCGGCRAACALQRKEGNE